MAIDEGTFRQAMSFFAAGVTVVTTEHEGVLYGMTVASFASLSLHPPLVLVCVDLKAKSHDAIAASGKFGVSILAQSQSDLSGRFGSKKIEDKFEGVAVHTGELGVPLLDGSICTLACRVHSALPGGDHTIYLGEVVDAQTTEEGAPLVYYRSGYRELA